MNQLGRAVPVLFSPALRSCTPQLLQFAGARESAVDRCTGQTCLALNTKQVSKAAIGPVNGVSNCVSTRPGTFEVETAHQTSDVSGSLSDDVRSPRSWHLMFNVWKYLGAPRAGKTFRRHATVAQSNTAGHGVKTTASSSSSWKALLLTCKECSPPGWDRATHRRKLRRTRLRASTRLLKRSRTLLAGKYQHLPLASGRHCGGWSRSASGGAAMSRLRSTILVVITH